MYKVICALLVSVFCLSCSDNVEDKVLSLANENLKLSLDNSENIKVLGVSKVDSAFGVNYFTEKEVRNLFEVTKQVSEKIMKATNNLTEFDKSDPAMLSLIEKQMKASGEIRDLLLRSNKKGEFSGYKLKIDYECKDANNVPYKAERWFFIDEKGEQVLRTFEIPLP